MVNPEKTAPGSEPKVAAAREAVAVAECTAEADAPARRINYPADRARPRAPLIAERRAEVARLHSGGLDTYKIADELGVAQPTIWHDVRALGLSPQPTGRPPKYPAPPSDRLCGHCRKPLKFRYPSDAADYDGRRRGLYCSKACEGEARRKHPKPEARLCANPRCDVVFVPKAAAVSRGGGRGTYCSAESRKAGDWLVCPQCGREHYRPRSEVAEVFCSRECWGAYRWRHKVGLEKLVETAIADGRFGGKRRQVWFGRWGGPKGAEHGIEGFHRGHEGGAPPKATPTEAAAIWKLHLETDLSPYRISEFVFGHRRYHMRVRRLVGIS